MPRQKPQGRETEWTTAEQKEWLEQRRPAHLAAQSRGGNLFSQLWAEIMEGWLVEWPLEPLTETEIVAGCTEAEKMARLKIVSHFLILNLIYNSPSR
jgi:hypothetical protein